MRDIGKTMHHIHICYVQTSSITQICSIQKDNEDQCLGNCLKWPCWNVSSFCCIFVISSVWAACFLFILSLTITSTSPTGKVSFNTSLCSMSSAACILLMKFSGEKCTYGKESNEPCAQQPAHSLFQFFSKQFHNACLFGWGNYSRYKCAPFIMDITIMPFVFMEENPNTNHLGKRNPEICCANKGTACTNDQCNIISSCAHLHNMMLCSVPNWHIEPVPNWG